MEYCNMPTPTVGRQMNLEFEPRRLEGLDDTERHNAVSILAQILMQAAGLVVEELSDDEQ